MGGDCVAGVFADEGFVAKYGVCTINSPNWARIMMQTVHFFYTYLYLCPQCDRKHARAFVSSALANAFSRRSRVRHSIWCLWQWILGVSSSAHGTSYQVLDCSRERERYPASFLYQWYVCVVETRAPTAAT